MCNVLSEYVLTQSTLVLFMHFCCLLCHITLHYTNPHVSFTLLCYRRQNINFPQKRVQTFKLPTQMHNTFTCQYKMCFQASIKKWIKISLFWFITQQVVVIPYRFLRTTNWFPLQDDRNQLFCHSTFYYLRQDVILIILLS